MAEVVGTFCLVGCIALLKYHYAAKDIAVNAMMVGTACFVGVAVTGPITGGCLNPAVGIV